MAKETSLPDGYRYTDNTKTLNDQSKDPNVRGWPRIPALIRFDKHELLLAYHLTKRAAIKV